MSSNETSHRSVYSFSSTSSSLSPSTAKSKVGDSDRCGKLFSAVPSACAVLHVFALEPIVEATVRASVMECDGGQRFHAVTADHAVLGAGFREFRIVPQEFDQFPVGNSHVSRLVHRCAADH